MSARGRLRATGALNNGVMFVASFSRVAEDGDVLEQLRSQSPCSRAGGGGRFRGAPRHVHVFWGFMQRQCSGEVMTGMMW